MRMVRLSRIGHNETTDTSESGGFTDFVRALGTGEPLDSPRFEKFWKVLRSALRAELKRRGLWESPPAFLGIYGQVAWETGGGKSHEGPLEELLAECYSYIFVSRLKILQAHLALKPNIDGLVYLNIRHFLHERQREHDPIGSQVFDVLQAAVRQAVEEGELRVLAGDDRIRNDTVLGFGSEMEDPSNGMAELPVLISRWNDELLPDLVTLRGRRQEEVIKRLRQRLPDLLRNGIATFSFKDLVNPLKADVRARWAALLDSTEGETSPQIGEEDGEVVRLTVPHLEVEERQVFRKLTECVRYRLKNLDTNEKTRRYLETLWQFITIQASEGAEALPESRLSRALGAGLSTDDEEFPSLRKLAEQLCIPRKRMPGLYHALGDLLENCRATIGSPHTGTNGQFPETGAKSTKVTVRHW